MPKARVGSQVFTGPGTSSAGVQAILAGSTGNAGIGALLQGLAGGITRSKDRKARKEEAEADRTFRAEEARKGRVFTAGENKKQRTFTSEENKKRRGLEAAKFLYKARTDRDKAMAAKGLAHMDQLQTLQDARDLLSAQGKNTALLDKKIAEMNVSRGAALANFAVTGAGLAAIQSEDPADIKAGLQLNQYVMDGIKSSITKAMQVKPGASDELQRERRAEIARGQTKLAQAQATQVSLKNRLEQYSKLVSAHKIDAAREKLMGFAREQVDAIPDSHIDKHGRDALRAELEALVATYDGKTDLRGDIRAEVSQFMQTQTADPEAKGAREGRAVVARRKEVEGAEDRGEIRSTEKKVGADDDGAEDIRNRVEEAVLDTFFAETRSPEESAAFMRAKLRPDEAARYLAGKVTPDGKKRVVEYMKSLPEGVRNEALLGLDDEAYRKVRPLVR